MSGETSLAFQVAWPHGESDLVDVHVEVEVESFGYPATWDMPAEPASVKITRVYEIGENESGDDVELDWNLATLSDEFKALVEDIAAQMVVPPTREDDLYVEDVKNRDAEFWL